jgi:hypothetical protein
MRVGQTLDEIHGNVSPCLGGNGQRVEKALGVNSFMLVNLTSLAFANKFLNIIAYSLPIEITFGTINRLMVARMPRRRVIMDILKELKLK